MKEESLRALIERLYLHVAAMPWADTGFIRSEIAQQAAHDHIVNLTIKEIMELQNAEEKTNSES